jgi:hypothetical protein
MWARRLYETRLKRVEDSLRKLTEGRLGRFRLAQAQLEKRRKQRVAVAGVRKRFRVSAALLLSPLQTVACACEGPWSRVLLSRALSSALAATTTMLASTPIPVVALLCSCQPRPTCRNNNNASLHPDTCGGVAVLVSHVPEDSCGRAAAMPTTPQRRACGLISGNKRRGGPRINVAAGGNRLGRKSLAS